MWAVDICRVGNGRTAFDRGGEVKPDIDVPVDGRPLSGVVDDGRVGGRLEDATTFCEDDAGMKNELGLVGDAGCEGYPSFDDLYGYEFVNGIETCRLLFREVEKGNEGPWRRRYDERRLVHIRILPILGRAILTGVISTPSSRLE
jgi:hypothetical protein